MAAILLEDSSTGEFGVRNAKQGGDNVRSSVAESSEP
jgi:hypothetical protein